MSDADFSLSDGKVKHDFFLDGGISGMQRRVSIEDRLGVDIRSQGRQIGDFDEQRNWKNGHGKEYLSDEPDGYFDGSNVFTANKNLLHNSLLQRFTKGLRSSDFALPEGVGGVDWQPLFAGGTGSHVAQYISRTVVATNTYSADKAAIWVRRKGSPGTLTLELCSNSAGSPGTVLKTVTKTITDIQENISALLEFDWTTTSSIVSATTYHIKVYGASADNGDNHWEVGVDILGTSSKTSTNNSSWTTAAFSMYFKLMDADIDRRIRLFDYSGCMYAVSQNDDASASKLYINGDRGVATAGGANTLTNTNKSGVWTSNCWSTPNNAYVKIVKGKGAGYTRKITSNTTTVLTVATNWKIAPDSTSEYIIYNTPNFTELTGHGLGNVVGRPVTFGGIVYFPQGSTTIRRMRFNAAASPPAHEYAADTSNNSNGFAIGNDAATGARLWSMQSGGNNVAWSPVKTWGTALVLTTISLSGDDTNYPTVNGIEWHENKLYVIKTGSAFSISGVTPTLENYGLNRAPSVLNGKAIISDGKFLYFSRLHSTMRVFGGSADDIGISWRGTGLSEERLGVVAEFEKANGWIFQAVDAGDTGTSSVHLYDGLAWHELADAPGIGKRIRDVKWQAMEDTFNRLWIDIGTELMYIDFPLYTNQLSQSTSTRYQHESIIVSSTIDMGTSARLPKFVNTLVAVTKNLGDKKYIGVDYQIDDDIGGDAWQPLAALMVSPEDSTVLNVGNIRKFRYRLRLNTNDSSVPIIVYTVAPKGFARVPWKITWDVRVEIRENTEKMRKWVDNVARFPGRVRMTSDRYPLMDNYFVIVSPPTIAPQRPEVGTKESVDVLQFTILEI